MPRGLRWNLLHSELLWKIATTKYQIWGQKETRRKLPNPLYFLKIYSYFCLQSSVHVGRWVPTEAGRGIGSSELKLEELGNCLVWVLGAQSWPPWKNNLLTTESFLQQPPVTFLFSPKSLGDHFSTCLVFIHPYKSNILYKNIPRKLSSRETQLQYRGYGDFCDLIVTYTDLELWLLGFITTI